LRGSANKGFGMFLLFMITGAVFGGILGEIIAGSGVLSGLAPYLVKTVSIIDIAPVTINLYVIKLVFGFALFPNLVSILGIIVAILLFRRF
jgi:uncharacterized membrane protein